MEEFYFNNPRGGAKTFEQLKPFFPFKQLGSNVASHRRFSTSIICFQITTMYFLWYLFYFKKTMSQIWKERSDSLEKQIQGNMRLVLTFTAQVLSIEKRMRTSKYFLTERSQVSVLTRRLCSFLFVCLFVTR